MLYNLCLNFFIINRMKNDNNFTYRVLLFDFFSYRIIHFLLDTFASRVFTH